MFIQISTRGAWIQIQKSIKRSYGFKNITFSKPYKVKKPRWSWYLNSMLYKDISFVTTFNFHMQTVGVSFVLHLNKIFGTVYQKINIIIFYVFFLISQFVAVKTHKNLYVFFVHRKDKNLYIWRGCHYENHFTK